MDRTQLFFEILNNNNSNNNDNDNDRLSSSRILETSQTGTDRPGGSSSSSSSIINETNSQIKSRFSNPAKKQAAEGTGRLDREKKSKIEITKNGRSPFLIAAQEIVCANNSFFFFLI